MEPRDQGGTFARISAAAVFALLGAFASPLHSQSPRCGNSQNIPLPDLTRPYRGLDFGLYPGRRATPPDSHLAAGIQRARKFVRPLDVGGNPSPNGKIILMSLGMSNTSSEFARFVAGAQRNTAINKRLTILNGSLSGADAAMWTRLDSPPWQHAISRVNSGRNSANQVQVIWIKQAHLRTAGFPEEIEILKTNLTLMLQIAKSVFPNLQIAYVSSRARGGAESRRGPGEPQAYETAFAVRRLIQEQIEGTGGLGVDAAWLSWGPYLWSNGTPRSDGFVWDCGDVERDMIHPTAAGNQKVADQLMAFFMTAQTATPWFLDSALTGRGPTIGEISSTKASGNAPLAVDFSARVSGATEYFWSFEDGTFSRAQNPKKTFHLDGRYDVRLTVTDASGGWANASTEIRVGRPTR